MREVQICVLTVLIGIMLVLSSAVRAQEDEGGATRKLPKEELAQLLAPIALYPDELVAQVLMASTYPIEIVQADRWVQQHKGLKGDALAEALEKERWDPSVKSLVNFPSVLASMSDKLDLTTKLGDVFLSQQKDVMETIQALRKKAYEAGNLKTTKEQKVVVQKETIVVQPANPQVVYVPTYSPAVVYGVWAYPAYPPYYYYPPPPPAYPATYFAAGVAVGAAWGYAWGSCNWHGGDVNINVNQNNSINTNIDRDKYKKQMQDRGAGQNGRGTWQHDPGHRKGVAYKDSATARKFGQSPTRSAEGRREARGFGDGRGGRGAQGVAPRGGGSAGARGGMDRQGAGDRGMGSRGGRETAFSGGFGNGDAERRASQRGSASRASGAGYGGTQRFRSGGGFGRGGRR